ncbi:hypothetical protein DKX38_027887 [Salix brachista]|uniref:poly(A)-specific ribonuclease n=1 Tax=Salix brachista TaxID=2182728 RepID=A0A5N5J4A1_9ROSI|nr:hypothetical protein DKX38_027887 [Salix brachista]
MGATELTRYEDLKHNVDHLRLIQFGITVADVSGNIGGTWEFNLRFDLSTDLFVSQSIQFLQDSGVDFDRLRRDGIHFDMFAQLLSRVVARHRNLCWVTFHGLYDLSHTLKTVTKRPLPPSVAAFPSVLGIVFGDVVDIKYMARFCHGLRGDKLQVDKSKARRGWEGIRDDGAAAGRVRGKEREELRRNELTAESKMNKLINPLD